MPYRRHRLPLLTLVVAASLQPSAAQDPLAAFTEIGVPDLRAAPLVRVQTGESMQIGNQSPEPLFTTGWLLSDGGSSFEVLARSLQRETFVRTGPITPEHQRVGYVPLDFEEQARRLASGDEAAAPEFEWFESGPHVCFGTWVALHAWAARQRGEVALAADLRREAQRLLVPVTGRGTTGRSLDEMLRSDLANRTMWQIIVDFGEPAVPISQLRERCGRFLEVFPDSRHAERAADTAELLDRMLEAASAHPPSGDLDALPAAARAAELVFRLRTQNGQQWSQPGSCDPALDPRGVDSPFARLVEMGVAAVPALIEALDDDTLTRSVGYHRDFYFSHQVLSVGDCAQAALARITGIRRLDAAGARRWLAEVQRNGEVAQWEKGTRQGDVTLAGRLAVARGAAALDALLAGLPRCGSDYDRSRMLAILASVDHPRAREVLREHLTTSSDDYRGLLTAAAALVPSEPDLVVDTVLAALARLAEQPASDSHDAFADTTIFLALTGDPRAISALTPHIDRLDAGVFAVLGGHPVPLRYAARFDAEGQQRVVDRLREAPWPPAGVQAAEQLLLDALGSERVFRGHHGEMVQPGTADFAAQALADRFPERYRFDHLQIRRGRTRQILAMRNAARARAGLPPLPGPTPLAVPPVDRKIVDDLVARIRRAPDGTADRAHFATALVDLGPGALTWLQPVLGDDALRGPSRKSLEGAARELCGMVIQIELHHGALQDPDQLRTALERNVGKPLQPHRLLDDLRQFLRTPPAGVGGLVLSVEREPGMPGLIVAVRLTPDPQPSSAPWLRLGRWEMVRAGDAVLHGSTGAGNRDHDWGDDFPSAVDAALRAPWNAALEAHLEVELRR